MDAGTGLGCRGNIANGRLYFLLELAQHNSNCYTQFINNH
jgi:hypothetical protein